MIRLRLAFIRPLSRLPALVLGVLMLVAAGPTLAQSAAATSAGTTESAGG